MTLSPLCYGCRSRFLPALVLFVSAAACGGAPSTTTGQDEPTETSQSNLNLSVGVWAWGTTDGTLLPLGSTSGQTCFLTGVAGDLNNGTDWVTDGNSFAGVFESGGNYFMKAWGGTSLFGSPPAAVMAYVACLGTTLNRTWSTWTSGNGPAFVDYLAPNRYCFLESVEGAIATWGAADASVSLAVGPNPYNSTDNNLYWWLNGTVQSSQWGHAKASAVCFDLPAGTQASGFYMSVPYPYQITGEPVAWSSNGMMCGLTGIAGPFNDSSWTDGAVLHWPPGRRGAWTLDLWNGKSLWADCAE
jgi:hypothetical protein